MPWKKWKGDNYYFVMCIISSTGNGIGSDIFLFLLHLLVEVICWTSMFLSHFILTKNEYLLGDLICFFCRIERKNAQFGMVRVYWQVLRLFPDASTTELLPGQEFTKVSDYVTFADGSSSKVLRLTPREDGIAEQDESFEIRLVNATGKIATWPPTNFTSKKKSGSMTPNELYR